MGRRKRIRILESGKFVLVESGIPGFRIRNPSSSDKESGIHGVESSIQDCLRFPYMERQSEFNIHQFEWVAVFWLTS